MASTHPRTVELSDSVEVSVPPAQEKRDMGSTTKKCPSCGSIEIIFDNERGEYICNSCGLIIEENVTDTGPEWRAFDADQRNARARTGAPIRYMKPNKGLVTEIDMYNKDIKGTKLPSKRHACAPAYCVECSINHSLYRSSSYKVVLDTLPVEQSCLFPYVLRKPQITCNPV